MSVGGIGTGALGLIKAAQERRAAKKVAREEKKGIRKEVQGKKKAARKEKMSSIKEIRKDDTKTFKEKRAVIGGVRAFGRTDKEGNKGGASAVNDYRTKYTARQDTKAARKEKVAERVKARKDARAAKQES